jgi:hypothetical protein
MIAPRRRQNGSIHQSTSKHTTATATPIAAPSNAALERTRACIFVELRGWARTRTSNDYAWVRVAGSHKNFRVSLTERHDGVASRRNPMLLFKQREGR